MLQPKNKVATRSNAWIWYEGWRCKIFALPQFCASLDVLSCEVLPESGGFTMKKSAKSSNFVTPDDSARKRKMRKMQFEIFEVFSFSRADNAFEIFEVLEVFRLLCNLQYKQ